MELVLLVWMQQCMGECDGGRQKVKKHYSPSQSLLPFTQRFNHFVPVVSAWAEALSKREKKEEELKNLELSSEF